MNKVILMGRLTRDPEVRYTQTGKVVCQFTLAVDRPFANQEGQREADFIAIVVWGKIAELCGNSLTKGQRALVDGRLQIRSYDAKDGTKRWVTEVIANSVEFIERKATGSGAPVQSGDAGPKSEMESFGSAVPFDEEKYAASVLIKLKKSIIRTLLSCAVILLNAAKFCPVVFPVTVLNINAK